LLYEFKTDLNKYLAGRRSPYKTLADLIKFNEENKEREMPLFGQELFLQSQKQGRFDRCRLPSSVAENKKRGAGKWY
jgi:amidase